MINSTKKLFSTNFLLSKTKAIILITFLVFNSLIANSQNIISVAFKDGAIGTQGSNPQQLNGLQNFQTLQVSKAYFIQSSGSNQFFAQGNDIPGVLRIVTTANKFVDIQGAIVWREGNNPLYIGFIPKNTVTFSLNLNTYGGANYTITEKSNFAILFNNKSFTFVNGASLSGNAAISSVLNDLNTYLTTFNTSRPAGPVTVTSQTTSSTTPTITGTVTLAAGESLSLEFNGVVYTTGITINGTNWTWTVPNSVLAGTYNVVATITNTAGYTLSDTSTDELVITDLNLSSLGCVTIVASGGDAEGSTWTYSNNTIMPNSAAAVNVNASVVLAKMALGNLTVAGSCIFVNAAVNDGSGSKTLTLKASGNIVVSANIITGGKDLTVWSDSDNNGAGGIRVDDNVTLDTRTQTDRTGNSNTTGGGKITLAGGLDDAGVSSGVNNLIIGQIANDGYPDGYAVNSGSTATQTGIVLGTSTSGNGHNSNIKVYSGGGNIVMQGLVTNNSSSPGNGPTALLFYHGYDINAGTDGNVILLGNANLTSGSWAIGMDLAAWRHIGYTANGLVQTHNGNISVVGRATGGTLENISMTIDGDGNNRNIFAITGSGSITLNGKAEGVNLRDIRLTNVDLLAASGDIKIVAEGASGTSIGGYNIGNGLFLGQKAGSLVTASSSDILIKSNILSNINKPIAYNTSGTVTIEPYADSFGSAFTLSNVTLENIITGLTLGKPTNTSNITFGKAVTISGPITAYGGDIGINATITTGATVTIESSGAVTQTAAITADKLSLNGTGTFTLNNTSNNIATIAGGNSTTKLGSVNFTDASGGLTIGTVGAESGLNATGAIAVETLVDDITLSEDVITNNTTANAIVINAGKTAAIGTATGGNIIVSGTPTVSTGTGGIIKLFSGSDAGSTGLTSFVGGLNNTRSNVDETTSSFSPGLTSNGKYALYRQAAIIVPPVITSFTPTTAGKGQTVVITGTGFTGVTIVKMGNVNASSFVVDSDTQITAVVGAARSGDVYVENSAGNDSKAGFVFKIVEYTFENNLLDETDANLDGNTSGNLTYGPGVEGKAICFTAGNNNDFVVLPNDLIRNLSDFTISLRFKTTSKGVMMGYQNNVVDANANQYIPILVVQSNGTLRGTLWTTANRDMSVVSSEVVNDGNWHRVDMSITTTSIDIYLDGTLIGSNNSGTVAHLQMSYNQLGRGRTDLSRDSNGGDLTGWEGFTGCIDNFVILDKGQSLAQINQSTALPQPTITSFAPITAKSGETVVITGTNLSGTTSLKIGGVNARSFKIISATEVHAIVGKDATVNTDIEITTAAGTATGSNFTFDCNSNALDFDGSNDYVVIGDQIENLGAFTQEAWVFWKGSSLDYSEIFTKENISAFAITNNNKLHANFGDGSRWGAGINSNTSIPLNTWTHVAVTRSSSGLVKLYINGVLDANTTTLSLTGNSPNSRVIGAKFVGNTLFGPFKGAIDELKVWNTERSVQQISAGMGSELVGNEVGLIAYYNFNQGSASGSNTTISSLNNLTGNTNLDGTLGNMALTGVGSNFVKGVWPVIISQPAASATVCPGGSISVSAVGEQLSYQWFSNNSASNAGGTPITGQTSATLTIPNSASGTQYYYVEITGVCSQIQTSNVSTVTISPEPVIAYDANYSLERTLAIANIIPTSTGATVSSYSISPALPAGLSLDSNTGVISGTPSAISAPVTYTVTGSSASSCTSTTTFSLEVFNAVAPSSLSYSPSTQTVKLGTSITVMTPTSTGGAVATFTISPSLPSGLTINPTTGIISGTLTQALTGSVTYTVTATNSGGTSTAEITLIFNSAPTDIALSPASIDENKSSGSAVGTLSSTDPDTGDTHTYTLVSGTGSTDNALFTIDGTQLKTTVSFDFETKSSYSVRIRTTDAGGLSYDKAITIAVLDVNDAPTSLALSETSTNENNAIGFVIGQLSSTDQDASDTHTYTLVSGTGSTDNTLFTIDGNNLKTTIAFDFETKSSYSIRVRTTDAGGLSYEKIITLTILDVNDAPTNISSTQTSIYEKNAVGAVIGDLSTTDQDAGDKHSYTLVSGDVAAFKISGNQLLANVVYNYGTKNSYEVVIKSTDAGGLSVNKSIKITILQQPNLFATANLPQNKQSSAVANNVTISKGYSANLNLSASNIVKYAWSPSTGLSATNISNPIANPTQTTTYTVTVTNAQGVSTNVYITVTVLEDYNITPNNVISPDGDGVNDFWTIENLNTYPNNEVKIFDKAGRIIFNVRNYQNNWNGQLNGQILHEGAYYYIINLGPGTRPKVGYITLFSNK